MHNTKELAIHNFQNMKIIFKSQPVVSDVFASSFSDITWLDETPLIFASFLLFQRNIQQEK